MISQAKLRLRTLRGGSSNAKGSAGSRPVAKLVLLLGFALLASLVLGVSLVSAVAPTVTVEDASEVKYTSAHVEGTVDPQGQSTSWRFQYISEAAYQQNLSNSAPGFEGANTGPEGGTETAEAVSGDLGGLKPKTVYHLRLLADNADGSSEAVATNTFETLEVADPSVSIDPVTTFTATTAHFTGTVDPNAPSGSLDQATKDAYKTRWDFQCTPTCPGLSGGYVEAEAGSSEVTADASGLEPNTSYEVKLVVSNAGGSEGTGFASFHTSEVGPEAETMPAFALGNGTEALVGGRINPKKSTTAFWVEWGTADCASNPCQETTHGQASADELQELSVFANKGTFNVTFKGQTTPDLPFDVSAQNLSSALEALSSVGTGNVAVHGGATPQGTHRYRIIFTGDLAATDLPQLSAASGTPVLEGSVQSATIQNGGYPDSSVYVNRQISGLTPGVEYHFRVVAENAAGETQGHDMSFEATPPAPAESCGNEALRRENNSTELTDCRAYEQVSPTDKNGYDAGARAPGGNSLPWYVAAEDGSGLAFQAYGAFGDAVSASIINTYLARRGDDGWSTHALSPPISPEGVSVGAPLFRYYSPDLRRATVGVPPGPALAPGATAGAENFYLRNNDTDTYQTLNLQGPGICYFVAATRDGQHILFEAGGQIYDWSGGQIEMVGIGPDGNPLPNAGLFAGASTATTTHAISEDGSRVVFRDVSVGDGALYLRENGQTFDISASQRSTPDPNLHSIGFAGASADTSKIYFTDGKALTDDAAITEINLYRYDADDKTLTNLTADPLPGSIARVEGVAAVSDDGSYVYFRSRSRFVPGEGDSSSDLGNESSNLYLWHNGTISLVALQHGYGGSETEANGTTYRLSRNGRYLTFSTPSRLTAYDNTDAVSGEPDSEVYRYDAVQEELTCVSCNPSGQAPDGPSSFPAPPLQERNPQVGATNDGRVFFNSADALVAGDVNGKEDVYEWKEGNPHLISSGTDGDSSFYAAAGIDGRDVFFITREQLVASDKDQILDVYDARIGGGLPQPPPPSPCEGLEGCHGPASNAPGLGSAASSSLSAGGQLSPAAQRLKAARKACNRKPKKSRAKCRAKAKKRFTKAGRAH